MKISSIANYGNNKISGFKGNENKPAKQEYYNPVNVKTEKKLAVLTSTGASAAVGVIGGLAVELLRGDKGSKKTSIIAGAIAAVATLALTLPTKIYNTGINATVKEKEMDVFTADRELKKDLTRSVHEEVQNPDVSLDKKLDDNLKLQLANKAGMVGFKTI